MILNELCLFSWIVDKMYQTEKNNSTVKFENSSIFYLDFILAKGIVKWFEFDYS